MGDLWQTLHVCVMKRRRGSWGFVFHVTFTKRYNCKCVNAWKSQTNNSTSETSWGATFCSGQNKRKKNVCLHLICSAFYEICILSFSSLQTSLILNCDGGMNSCLYRRHWGLQWLLCLSHWPCEEHKEELTVLFTHTFSKPLITTWSAFLFIKFKLHRSRALCRAVL